MIRRVAIPGGSYAEAFPDGSYYCLVGNDVVTTNGVVRVNPFGADYPLHLRAHPRGFFAGQGHESGRVVRFDGQQWHVEGMTCGVNSVCYAPDGVLHINDACQLGTQGIRWIDEQGIHTGDETYNGSTTTRVAEWTDRGNVRVGQSYVDGCTIYLFEKRGDEEQRGWFRQLEPGHCTFVRFNRTGSTLAISMWKQLENCAVLFWLDEADIASLPLEPTQVIDPPIDPIDPPQTMKLPDTVFATLVSIRNQYRKDRPLEPEEIGEILNATAWVHRKEGAGLQRKDSGTNCPQPKTGIPCWRGFRMGTLGFDVCGACTVGRFDPVQADGGPADAASFVPPVDPSGIIVQPDPDIDAKLAALRAELLGTIADAEFRLAQAILAQGTTMAGDVRRLDDRIDALPAGSTFNPAKYKTITKVRARDVAFGNDVTGRIEEI